MSKIICDKCDNEFERNNIYGTRCPKCNNLIKPDKEPDFRIENKLKLKELQSEFLEKLKKKLTGDKNANK